MDVLLTGAEGRMARVVRPALRERYGGLRLLAREAPDELAPGEELHLCDLADADAVVAAAEGADAIVHLGGVSDEAPFETVLASNVIGTYNVFEAGRRGGARRIVFASSNHVTGFYPCATRVGVGDPLRPDTLYGASKAYGEALASLYHDKWGIEVVSLRIGSFRERPQDARQLSSWLSHRDGVQLVVRALEAPKVGALVVYGVSANHRSWWKRGPETERLGFEPLDDAERFAAELPQTRGEQDLQGGTFTDPDYTGGYF